jgi:hypothetical protein
MRNARGHREVNRGPLPYWADEVPFGLMIKDLGKAGTLVTAS